MPSKPPARSSSRALDPPSNPNRTGHIIRQVTTLGHAGQPWCCSGSDRAHPLARLGPVSSIDLAASRPFPVACDATPVGGGELLDRRSGGHRSRTAQRRRALHRTRHLGGSAQPRCVQRVLAALGPVPAAIGVVLLFGAGHTLSGIWFSRPLNDTVFITINAAEFGLSAPRCVGIY